MSDFLTATMTLVDESTVSLSEGSIASGSWSFKKTTGSGGYEIGGCAISSCNFTIIDTVGNYNESDFENAEVSVFLNGSTTPYWKGYVKTATQAYNKIVITAYDKMAKGDEQVIGYINSTGKINMTRSDLASAIATFMGLTGVTGLNNGSAVIPEMDTTCTYRQAIAYMAEAGGQFAYVDTVNDRLVFAWYSGTETPASIFGRNLSRSGTTIDCVNVIAYDGEYAEISPSLGDMLIEVSGNPCIVGNRDTGTFTTDLTNIVNALVGNTFISGTLTIASDPDLEIGTYINLSHHGQPYLLPVASLTYKPNGTMVISCDNVGNMKVSSADMRSTSAQQSLYNDISNKKSKLAQALGQGGGGGTPSGGANILTFAAGTKFLPAAGVLYVNGIIFVNNAYTYHVWACEAQLQDPDNFTIARDTKIYIPDTGVQVEIELPIHLTGCPTVSCSPDGSVSPQQTLTIADNGGMYGNAVMRVLGSVDESGTKFNVTRYEDLYYSYENKSTGSSSQTYHKETAILSMYPLKAFSTRAREIPCNYEVATINHVSAGTGTTVNSSGAVSVNTETDSDVDDAIDGILIS